MICKTITWHIMAALLLLTGCRAAVRADGAEATRPAQTRMSADTPAAFSATVATRGDHCRVFVHNDRPGRIKLKLPVRPGLIEVHGIHEPIHLHYEPTADILGLLIGPGMYMLEISEFTEKNSGTHTADATGGARP